LRRLIFAFAVRTACALAEGFLGGFSGFLSIAGIRGCAWAGILDRCCAGCTLMGPVIGDLGRDITDKLFANQFVRLCERPKPCKQNSCCAVGKVAKQFG